MTKINKQPKFKELSVEDRELLFKEFEKFVSERKKEVDVFIPEFRIFGIRIWSKFKLRLQFDEISLSELLLRANKKIQQQMATNIYRTHPFLDVLLKNAKEKKTEVSDKVQFRYMGYK